MTRLVFELAGEACAIDVDPDNPLGWRWWTLAGMPECDPVEGHRYGQTRCVPLEYVPTSWGGSLMLCAMELDGALHLCSPHELFPILDKSAERGADRFVRDVLSRHAAQPDLFG